MTVTKNLITIMEGGDSHQISINSIINKAYKDKVLLHVLRVLDIQGVLREFQESAIKRVSMVVQVLSKLLRSYDYAFFKLVKPVTYVPADVDLLVGIDHVGEVTKEIVKLGYRIVVKDPYCVTLTKADSIIDLYVHPSLGGVILLNGQKLLEHTGIKSFNGIEVRAIESYAEALMSVVHAIYKERIYTINDYFTVEKWISSKTYKLAQELQCREVLDVALDLNRRIRQGLLETPYKIPTLTWIVMLLRKFQDDNLTRATSVNVLKALINRRGISLLMSKFTRETY